MYPDSKQIKEVASKALRLMDIELNRLGDWSNRRSITSNFLTVTVVNDKQKVGDIWRAATISTYPEMTPDTQKNVQQLFQEYSELRYDWKI